MRVLDLFSAAAGGWSLGLHRAGFQTVAACEWIDWRRTLYAENNPGVLIYDDVRTLTADRLRADLGALPDIVVGSPPCQDISSANTKGKGVDGERSGLFFEAVRIIGEVRPRWFALENSANLRTRGADRVLGELEALGYACWARVVGGDDIGANHERKRSWIIGCDVEQLADAQSVGCQPWPGDRKGEHAGVYGRLSGHNDGDGLARHAAEDGCGPRLPGRRAGAASGAEQSPCGDAADTGETERRPHPDEGGHRDGQAGQRCEGADRYAEHAAPRHVDAPNAHGHALRFAELPGRPEQEAPLAGDANPSGSPADADQAGQADGSLVASLRQEEIADDGCGVGRGDDRSGIGQMGLCEADRRAALQRRADWSLDDLARHIRLDDGLPAWVADTRVAVGGPRGTSAASLIVEAFGDSVLPQIPEAIGRAILRVEAAYAALHAPANDAHGRDRAA